MIIDTHAHVYLPQFSDDSAEVIQKALDKGVSKIFLPNIDSSHIESLNKLSKAFPEICYPLIGLHPCSVKENYKEELAIIEKELKDNTYYGIGETGLDYYWDTTFKAQQQDSLHTHCEIAIREELPLILHCRDSMDDVIRIVSAHKNTKLKGIFHCFSGSLSQAEQIIDLGFSLGIGGVVTFKNGGVDKVLADIPLTKIVVETDSPYLAPSPNRGKRNEPAYLEFVIKKIAEVYSITAQEVEKTTSENALEIFQV